MADGLVGRIDLETGNIAVEAEDVIGAGFTTESHGVASGGRTVSLLDTGNRAGVLGYDFEGAAGTYDLAITAHDEFDGESTLSVWVNGVRLREFTLDADTPPGVVSDANRVVLSVEGLSLQAGDRVEIRAEQDAAEWVRIDRLDFALDGAVSPPPPPPPPPPVDGPTIGLGETQAEALDLSGGFEIETRADARDGALVRTLDELGEATGTFTGGAGTYRLDVTYFDESDGVADFALVVNGVVAGTWQGEQGSSALGTAAVESLTVDLQPGDEITLRGVKGGEELARIDALTVTLVEPAEPDNAAPEVNRPIANQTGAEGILFAFQVPNNTFTDADGDALSLTAALVGGGALPDWLKFDPATNTFSGRPADGDDGLLDITVTASDGTASVSDTFRLDIADMGDIPAALNVGLNEAEDLTLDGYVIENRNSASSSQLIRTFGEGEATGQFSGPSGRYRLDLVYQEESDGKSDYAVLVNGAEVFAFRADKGPRALGTDATVSVELDLDIGDVVTIRGSRGQEALARLDTVSLTPLDTGPVNTPPVAQDDMAASDEDAAVTLAVLANDSDTDGDPLTITLVSGAENGSAALNSDGTVTFTPDADFNGTGTFTYTISDSRGGAATATATIVVAPVNDAPVPLTDTVVVDEDGAVNGQLEADDVDGDGLTFSLADGGAPANGTVEIDPDGVFLYEPAPDFVGTDSFTYTVSDGEETVAQTVTVTVGAANDAPLATDDTATTDEDTAVTLAVLANDSDPDADGLSIAETTDPANGAVTINGDGTITYTPDADFNGTDTFGYTLTDGSLTDTATVTVTINPVSDPAVIDGTLTGAVTEDGVLEATGMLLVADPDTGEAAFIAQTDMMGVFGSFSISESGNWIYNLRNADANVQNLSSSDAETDAFVVSSIDGTQAVVTITVNGTDEDVVVNTPPTVSDFTGGSTDEDTAQTFARVFLIGLGQDADGDTLDLLSVGGTSALGASVFIGVTGNVLYDPNPSATLDALPQGESVIDSFTFTLTDGQGGAGTGTVFLTVTGVNDPAVIDGTLAGSVTEDSVLEATGALLVSDIDTGEASFVAQADTAGTFGTFSVTAGGAWAYSLNNGAANVQMLDSGAAVTDTFLVASRDGTTQAITITVNGADEPAGNTAPVVSPIDGGTIAEDAPAVTLDLLDPASVSDADGDPLTAVVTSATDNTGAPVGFLFDGQSITLDPFPFRFLDDGESRTITVAYAVSDGEASVANTATLTVTGIDGDTVIVATDAVGDEVPVLNEINYLNLNEAFNFVDFPTVAPVAGGRFVVSWIGIDEDGTGIFAQVFDQFGDAVGREIQVNQFTDGNQDDPHIEPLDFGGFAVTWNPGRNDANVAARFYDADGYPITDEFVYDNDFSNGRSRHEVEYINGSGVALALPVREGSSTFSVTDIQLYGLFNDGGTRSPFRVNENRLGSQDEAKIADLGDGTFIVAWISRPAQGATVDEDPEQFGIRAQIFTDAFERVGDEFQVASMTETFGIDDIFDIATLADGSFVVTWAGESPFDGSEDGILARRYSGDGTPLTDAFAVNTETLSDQDDPQVTALANGGYVITFISNGLTGDDFGSSIQARIFDGNDNPVTGEFRVNTDTTSSQLEPGITALDDGGFVITWDDAGNAFNAAVFEADGTPRSQGGASQNGVLTLTTDFLTANDVNEVGQDGSSTSIQARFFSDNGAPVAQEFRVNSEINNGQNSPVITELAGGRFVVVWQSSDLVDDPSGLSVKVQVFEADGTPVGAEGLVNTVIANDQFDPSVVMLADGGFVVTYTSTDRGEGEVFSRIKAQRFEADGTPRGSEFNINAVDGDFPNGSQVVGLTGGGFAVRWQETIFDNITTEDVNETQQLGFIRFFDANAQPVSDEINIDPDSGAQFQSATITALEDGNVLVTRADYTVDETGASTFSDQTIIGQVYGPDGQTIGAEFDINGPDGVIDERQSVSALEGGGFVAVWQSTLVEDGNTVFEVRARIFDENNQPVGAEFTVTDQFSTFGTPGVTATSNGGFAVTYLQITDEVTFEFDYVAQFYDSDGTPEGAPVPIQSQAPSFDTDLAGTGLSGSNVAFVWSSDVESRAVAPLVITEVSDTSALGALVSLNEDGTVNYDPRAVAEVQALAPGETLTDTFTYSVRNGSGAVDTATVTVTVFGEDAPPSVTPIDAGIVTEEAPVVFIDLLDGAFDREGQPVTISTIKVSDDAGGIPDFIQVDETTVGLDPEIYTFLDAGESRTVTVDFQVSDGTRSIANTATLVIEGTDNAIAARDDVFAPTAEFLVNQFTNSTQTRPSITATDEGFAISWTSFDAQQFDTSRSAVKTILFDADGAVLENEARVNQFTFDDQTDSEVATLADGTLVFVWTSDAPFQGDLGSTGVKAILWDGLNGRAIGSEFLVAEFSESRQNSAKVVALDDGGFAIVWTSSDPTLGDTSSSSVNARFFDADGTPRTPPGASTSEILVNQITETAQSSPDVTVLSDGRLVIAWQGNEQDANGIFSQTLNARVFNADGTPANDGGTEFRIDEPPTENRSNVGNVEISALDSGGFVAVWQARFGRDESIVARRFDSDGDPLGGEFIVNQPQQGSNLGPEVTTLADGSFVIIWQSDALNDAGDPQDVSIRAKVYEEDGTVRLLDGQETAEFVVNDLAPGRQSDAAVAAMPDGGFVITWVSNDPQQGDASSGGIKARVFNADGTTRDVGGVFENQFVRIREELLLANDGSLDSAVEIIGVSGSALGAFVGRNPDGTITYDPRNVPAVQALEAGEVLADTFTYTIRDFNGGTDSATVTIIVRGTDDAGSQPLQFGLFASASIAEPPPALPEGLESHLAEDSFVFDGFHQSHSVERAAPLEELPDNNDTKQSPETFEPNREGATDTVWMVDAFEFPDDDGHWVP